MMLAKKVPLREVVARSDEPTALNARHAAIQRALDALEQIDASPQIKQQIRHQTLCAREAVQAIWLVIRGMQLSEYFDPHVYAAELFVDREKRRGGVRKTHEAQRKKKEEQKSKAAPPPTKHPLTAQALELFAHYKTIFPGDVVSAEASTARDLHITCSKLKKEILTPARAAHHLFRFNAKAK